MSQIKSSLLRSAFVIGATLLPLFVVGCKSSEASIGRFEVLTSNVSTGDTWLLNRPIQLFFNNAIDPNSVNFASVILRPTDQANSGNPVTGTFDLITDAEGNKNFGIQFNPACPDNVDNSNGGFIPGNFGYELVLPTVGAGGAAILRDTAGNQLAIGLTRTFRTPSVGESLFADTIVGPPRLDSLVVPDSLGLISQNDSNIILSFNQSVNPEPINLAPNRIFVQYSNAVGAFPLSGNIIPGALSIVSNCGDGAVLHFAVSGVMIPGRDIRVVLTSNFEDLGGNTNSSSVASAAVSVPTIAEFYADGPSINEDDVTFDEYADYFANSNRLDLDANLSQPPAAVSSGFIQADFPFPGTPVGVNRNFVVTTGQGLMQVDTSSTTQVTDGNGKVFDVVNGVLNVHDFRIEAGATLRALGSNPLVVYVSGEAILLGTLDASGFNASAPDGAVNAWELSVPGAFGVCGGGNGGASSQIIDNFTARGESGQGAFGVALGGGQGGEGGYQQDRAPALSGTLVDSASLIAGGGAGGGFSEGRTDSIFWDRWSLLENPNTFDNAGPDLRADRHTIYNATIDPDTAFLGAEDGLRGSALGNQIDPADQTRIVSHGVEGFEDRAQDGLDGTDFDAGGFDLAETGGTIGFPFGNPSLGPDGGLAGRSIFNDADVSNNFWGHRFVWDGTPGVAPILTTGELSAPAAGSGGGGSGDMQTIFRFDLDFDTYPDTVNMLFPDPNFTGGGYTARYFRGASGGGGGGQVQLMCLGPITLGPAAILKVNGGAGNGGDSTADGGAFATTSQVSGSGGGSGGHLVMHSASGLNLSLIDVGTAGDPGVPATFFDSINNAHSIQAIGGRRGWAASRLPVDVGFSGEGNRDGNSSFMVGRGGAGASGLIQIHVPNPLTDITYHTSVDAAFKQYITDEDLTNPVISDRQDEVLGVYAIPVPFTLVPFFSPESQVQSVWVDTGLAELRNPANGTGPFPDFLDATLGFEGIDQATGMVLTGANLVTPGSIAGSDAGAGSASFTNFTVTISNPSASFGADLLRNPNLLNGYDMVPDATQVTPQTFEIVDAVYTASPETLVLTTRVSDGPMALIASTNWVVRTKFFRISTTETKDRLPSSASVRIQFQGTEETTPGSNTPDLTAITDWTGDGVTTMSDLQGKRFIRYRLTFDIDALDSGPTVDKEKPGAQYLKFPWSW
ncbi:MAG: hypothetical protein O3A50_02500 [Planctomycetota bacterium]|nr:hypothetical protein [Planctomycetota bacterium]